MKLRHLGPRGVFGNSSGLDVAFGLLGAVRGPGTIDPRSLRVVIFCFFFFSSRGCPENRIKIISSERAR